jgi:hypothetical protein
VSVPEFTLPSKVGGQRASNGGENRATSGVND